MCLAHTMPLSKENIVSLWVFRCEVGGNKISFGLSQFGKNPRVYFDSTRRLEYIEGPGKRGWVTIYIGISEAKL